MRILLASSNPHKLEEISAVFVQCATEAGPQQSEGASPIELVSLSDLHLDVPEPVEDADTFEGNAILKARYYADAARMHCLADDSGLEVDALHGEPGVRSARYAGVTGPRSVVDPANNRLLIERLGDAPPDRRGARFVCAMALCGPGAADALVVVRGTVEGRILTRDEAGADARGRGDNGFGYDPLFYIPDLGRTTAQLPPQHKNRISHRGDAARKMWRRLVIA